MAHTKIELFDIAIDNLSMEESIAVINTSIDTKQPILHIVVNAAKMVHMLRDEALFKSIQNADLVNVDGMAVVWASRFLGKPLKERVSGVDLFLKLMDNAHVRGESVYLLGAQHEVVEKVASIFQEKYGTSIVAGFRDGYFSKEEEASIVEEIVTSGAQYLYVAISSPMKEIFLSRYKEELRDVGFIMGVGGSFDVVSGKVKRAPKWMQECGLEWFYRFLQEPKRMWKRSFIDNGKFVGMVIKEKFKKV